MLLERRKTFYSIYSKSVLRERTSNVKLNHRKVAYKALYYTMLYSHSKMIAWLDVGKHRIAAIFKHAIDRNPRRVI